MRRVVGRKYEGGIEMTYLEVVKMKKIEGVIVRWGGNEWESGVC